MNEEPVLKKSSKFFDKIFSVFFFLYRYNNKFWRRSVLVGINKAQQFRPLFCNPGTDPRHSGTARRSGKDDPDSGREEGPGRVS
jgi:hypothetical protein